MSISNVNTRNQFQGRILGISRSPIVSEIEIETPIGIIAAIVTTTSIDRSEMGGGADALALFKATSVMVAKLRDAADSEV